MTIFKLWDTLFRSHVMRCGAWRTGFVDSVVINRCCCCCAWELPRARVSGVTLVVASRVQPPPGFCMEGGGGWGIGSESTGYAEHRRPTSDQRRREKSGGRNHMTGDSQQLFILQMMRHELGGYSHLRFRLFLAAHSVVARAGVVDVIFIV